MSEPNYVRLASHEHSSKNDLMSEDTDMLMKKVSVCAAMVCLAGTPVALSQSGRPDPATRQDQRVHAGVTQAVSFQTFDEFRGRNVYHIGTDDHVATIKDLIVDRGSGEVMHVVLKTGDFLGLGGKEVALPYAAFDWNSAQERVELRYTQEALKNMSAFRAESWEGLLTESNAAKYDAAYKQLEREQHHHAQDPYADSVKDYPTASIKGEVQRVVRPSDRSGEPSYLLIKTADGSRKVVLGPSWYMVGYSVAPERGDTISIEAYELPRAGEQTYLARTIKTSRGEMTLRGNDGRAMWSDTSVGRSGDAGYVPFRFVTLSEVVGKDCKARGQDCGEVKKAIIECESGQVAFLAIDPDENFLGIGDELHLVPWSVARVYADSVALDASKEMILNSAPMPKNIKDLQTRSNWAAAYKTFDVDAPNFQPYNAHSERLAGSPAWYERAELREVVRNGTPETITGELIRSSTHEDKQAQGEECSTIVLSTPQGEREVVIAPASFMKLHDLEPKPGEQVTVRAVRAVVNGEPIWIAKSITSEDGTYTLWSYDLPAWARR